MPVQKQQFNELINGTSESNKHDKSNILFFDDMINIKNFHSNLSKIDKMLYKNINIYNIGYITVKKLGDYENLHSVNLL